MVFSEGNKSSSGASTSKREYKYVSVHDLKNVLESLGFTKLSGGKREILKVGCELLHFTKDDIAYIANPDTTINSAYSRLRSCRQNRTY